MSGDKNLYENLSYFLESVDSSRFSLVQIGASNGKDHVNELALKYGKPNNWNCLFVEPIGIHFLALKKTYEDTGYLFEQSAISNKSGEATFYTILPESLSNKASNAANITDRKDRKIFSKSLKRGSLVISNYLLRVSHKETGEQPILSKSMVRTLTLKDLLLKHRLEKVDFLSIDTEGYDFEIIKQIDFSPPFRPLIVCYEEWGGVKFKEGDDLSGGINLGPTASLECRDFLQKNKYSTYVVESEDTTKNIIAIDSTRSNFRF
jgi:FkbM family methyltransferase